MRKEIKAQQQWKADYNPNRLLDVLLEKMQLKNDDALSCKLRVATSVIQNIRDGKTPVAGSMLMWMHEATGISIAELRALMGDRRLKCRPVHIVSR